VQSICFLGYHDEQDGLGSLGIAVRIDSVIYGGILCHFEQKTYLADITELPNFQ
jgi:hypothetical protein